MALRRSTRARQPRVLSDYVNPDDIFSAHTEDPSNVKSTKNYYDDLFNADSVQQHHATLATDSEAENNDPGPPNHMTCDTAKTVSDLNLQSQSWTEERQHYDCFYMEDGEGLSGDVTKPCNKSKTSDRSEDIDNDTIPSMSSATILSKETRNSSVQKVNNVLRHKKSKTGKNRTYIHQEKMPCMDPFVCQNQRKDHKEFAEDSGIDVDPGPIDLSSRTQEVNGSTPEGLQKSENSSTVEKTAHQRSSKVVTDNDAVSAIEADVDSEHETFLSGNEDESSGPQFSCNGLYETDNGVENEGLYPSIILDCESDDDEEAAANLYRDEEINGNVLPPDITHAEPTRTEDAISNCDNQLPTPTDKPQRVLKCPFCQYLAIKSSHLKRHIRIHTGERPHKCPHCHYSAIRKEHLLRHFSFKHKEVLRVSCQLCRYRTTDEQSLNLHLKLAHPEMCNHVFKCLQCDFQSLRKSQYVEHAKSHRVWECPICQYTTPDWMTYRQHKRSHPEERPFSCPMCPYTAKLKVDLERHLRAHTGERPFTCPHCSYRAARKDSLVRHMRTHTGDKPYQCPLCDFASAQQGHLVTHIRTHTGERPFTCTCCDYSCCDRSSLVKHVRIHTGERPYKCPHCPFAAIRKHDLKDHINIHTGLRPYKCTQCSYAAADRSTLRSHTKKHNRKADFVCKLCDFSCKHKSTLVKHLNKHNGTRPYQCPECNYSTGNKACLQKHVKQHGGDPLSCKMCDLAFGEQEELLYNIVNFIKEDPDPGPPPQHGSMTPGIQNDNGNHLSFKDVTEHKDEVLSTIKKEMP